MNTSRNSTTHTPSARRVGLRRLADVVEEVHRVAHEAVVLGGTQAPGRDLLEVIEYLLVHELAVDALVTSLNTARFTPSSSESTCRHGGRGQAQVVGAGLPRRDPA